MPDVLAGRHILLGVTGSIAAYKAAIVTRMCVEAGAEIFPILTRSAQRFVGALTFSTLSRHRAITDLWSAGEGAEIGHVELAHQADAVLIAPCTANTLARLAAGTADDPLTAIALSTAAPLLIAPAMEEGMWNNTSTQKNLAHLVSTRGARVIPPATGELASGRTGAGRLAEPETIVEHLRTALTPPDLKGHRFLITAGPTREFFDPVRFISNPSTGKMGYAIARQAQRRGAEVTLITGPTSLTAIAGIRTVTVESAQDMLEACARHLDPCSVWVMAAAPADHRPAQRSPTKVKKTAAVQPHGEALTPTPDILRTLGGGRKRIVVGFAAESNNVLEHAAEKLKAKELDLIVANDITRADAGFASETNAVTFIRPDGSTRSVSTSPKDVIADEVLNEIATLLPPRGT